MLLSLAEGVVVSIPSFLENSKPPEPTLLPQELLNPKIEHAFSYKPHKLNLQALKPTPQAPGAKPASP